MLKIIDIKCPKTIIDVECPKIVGVEISCSSSA